MTTNNIQNPQELQENGELVDMWIDAIPDNVYDLCPCGCGKKWKFVKNEPAEHEQAFYDKIRSTKC